MKSIAFLNNNNKQTEIKNFKYNNTYHCPKDNEILVNKSEKKNMYRISMMKITK